MIESRRVYLRSFDEDDLDTVWMWKNDVENNLYESSNPYVCISKEQIKDIYLNEQNSKNTYAICTKRDNKLIGEISYWIPNHLFQSTVELGILIGDKEYRKFGYGIDAWIGMIKVIFNNSNINRISMYVSSHNHFSKSPLCTLFEPEGIIRSERYINGEYYDTYIFGLLRKDLGKFMARFSKYN